MACEVSKVYMFELTPHVLLRIDFRRVRRKVLDRQPSDTIHPTELVQLLTSVNPGTVPEEQHSPKNVHEEVSHELHGLTGANRRFVHLNVQVSFKRQPADHRQVITPNRTLQHWSTANR